ncbi:MAG: hypothetical protein M3Z25_05795 [Actinomycetota bacterium]|nr:hypothetical protein [Actinomycetota bacterium]
MAVALTMRNVLTGPVAVTAGPARPAGEPAYSTRQAPGAGGDGAAISQLRESRQSTDPQVQAKALNELQCSRPDPLDGYVDSSKPLVTCNENGDEKYLLGPAFLQLRDSTIARMGTGEKGEQAVMLHLPGEESGTLGNYTTRNAGKRIAIVDSVSAIFAPRILDPIIGGEVYLSGYDQSALFSRLTRK